MQRDVARAGSTGPFADPGASAGGVRERGARASVVRSLLLLGACAAGALAARAWSARFGPLQHILGRGVAAAVLALLVASLGAELWALAREWRAPRAGGASALRWAVHVAFWTCVLQIAWLDPFRTILFQALAAVGAGVFAAGLLGVRALGQRWPVRAVTRLEVLSTVALVVGVGGELTARVVARVRPSPLLLVERSGPIEEMEASRFPAGKEHYGSRCNSRGYLDGEPDPSVRPFAAVIGDSFGFCCVGHEDHYASVAERRLGRGELYDMGIVGVGADVYLAMLEREALALRPDVVVIALFLGNDVPERPPEPEPPGLRGLLARDSLRSLAYVRRLAALSLAWRRADAHERGDAPWREDPLLEPPGFSEETFLDIEVRRARVIAQETSVDPVRTLVPVLEDIVAVAGPVPVLFLLIPDEFQVEDEVWERVASALGREGLDRDRVQRLLRAAFDERGWRYLDLLPALRAVPPLADGRRHVYHLRDTHFNKRGCEVAGNALADALAPWWGG